MHLDQDKSKVEAQSLRDVTHTDFLSCYDEEEMNQSEASARQKITKDGTSISG